MSLRSSTPGVSSWRVTAAADGSGLGSWDEATEVKARVEGKSQAREKKEHHPLWFRREEDAFAYQGGYWEAKRAQQWNNCPDIF